MVDGLRQDTLFVALTRPQMFAGVTYSFFVINAIVALFGIIISCLTCGRGGSRRRGMKTRTTHHTSRV